MLSIVDANTRAGLSRRSFLRIGTLGLGGLSLADLLAARAATGDRSLPQKAVVLLFLQGGPPQHETFDPKMGAPAEVRSTTGELKTKLPGVTFGGTFPKMAALADRLAVVRSFASKNVGHTYETTVHGGFQSKAAVSALYARLAGPMNQATGLPSNIVVVPEAVREGLKLGDAGGTGPLSSLITPGSLGGAYEAFNPAGGGAKKLMDLAIPRDRFEDRQALLHALEGARRSADLAADKFDRIHQQAADVILRGTASAFDLSKEDPRVLERYDTSKIFRMEDYLKYGNMKRSTNLLGRQMLLARRLVENGCGFVTVSDCGWDFHADNNCPPGMTAMKPLGEQVDHAVSAFMEDVRERGLEDRILLVVTGEMGRTPKLNGGGGREHWGDLTPLVFAGGGLKMGQVIGESDRLGSAPRTEVYTPANLVTTLLHFLFDVPAFRARTDVPPAVKDVFDNGTPIRDLFA